MQHNVLAYSLIVVILIVGFLIASILFIFYFYWGVPSPLSNSLTIATTLFGGLATLGASIIAAYLFNDWRHIKTADNKSELAREVLRSLITIQATLDQFYRQAMMHAHYPDKNSRSICEDLRSELKTEIPQLLKDFRINLGIYELVCSEEILKDDEHLFGFNQYLYAINAVFREIIESKKTHSPEFLLYIRNLENQNIKFKESYINPIVTKLRKHIILLEENKSNKMPIE
ncbi:TPA: hypothetical protein OUH79_002147 [Acinetobacter baumannii]|nr:hypothetical protein [Acinetobacter baumannii]